MFKKILLRNILFSLALYGIVWGLRFTIFQQHIHSTITGILIFYFVLSMLVSWMMEIAIGDKEKFVPVAMGAIVLRLLITVLSMVVVVIAGIENQESFIINFFIVYLCYLIFELTTVLSNLRPNSFKLK